MEWQEWVLGLEDRLRPIYSDPKRVIGGHGWVHVSGLIALGGKVAQYLPIDTHVYTTAVLLHNLDRVPEFAEPMKNAGGESAWVMDYWLADSPFSDGVRHLISDAVVDHTKKDLGSNPSIYLMALTDADKADRLTAYNVMDGAAHWKDHPFIDMEHPYDYRHAKESLLRRFMWNLEWVGMMSCDEARQLLINPVYFQAFILYIRALGQQIPELVQRSTGAVMENKIEDEIKTALGVYYEWTMKFTGLTTR